MDMLKGRSCFFYSVVVCSFIDIFDIFVNNFMNGLMGGGGRSRALLSWREWNTLDILISFAPKHYESNISSVTAAQKGENFDLLLSSVNIFSL